MPNGGSDHCGNCRHNRVNIGREATREERRGPAFCTVRNIEIRAYSSTYCANHYASLKVPLGPMYTGHDEHDRLPYHDGIPPQMSDVFSCHVCGGASRAPRGVKLPTAAGPLFFCGAAHYVRWWKQAHPGETLKWDCDAPPLTPEQNLERIADGVVELARAYVAVGDLKGARETLEHSERLTGVALNPEGRALLASLDS